MLRDHTSNARLKLGLWWVSLGTAQSQRCCFLCVPEVAALRRGPNRDSLVAGLQEGATDVSFQLKGCTDAEFTVLCKAMAVQGPAVRRVVSEEDSFHAERHIDSFVAALASCSHLVELRWVLCFPSSWECRFAGMSVCGSVW